MVLVSIKHLMMSYPPQWQFVNSYTVAESKQTWTSTWKQQQLTLSTLNRQFYREGTTPAHTQPEPTGPLWPSSTKSCVLVTLTNADYLRKWEICEILRAMWLDQLSTISAPVPSMAVCTMHPGQCSIRGIYKVKLHVQLFQAV